MRVFWWQGGLHIEPETSADRKSLEGAYAVLEKWEGVLKMGHADAHLQHGDGETLGSVLPEKV